MAQPPQAKPLQLQYAQSVVPSSELDYEFERDWARSLRIRFLWYCAAGIGLATLMLLILVLSESPPQTATVNGPFIPSLIEQCLTLSLYAAAWVYVYRFQTRRQKILVLAVWLFVIISILSLLATRLIVPAGLAAIRASAESQPATASMDGAIASAQVWAPFDILIFYILGALGLFIRYLVLCLFLPLSFRQSLRPALLILGALAVGLFIEVARRLISIEIAIFVMLVALMALVPGAIWCWWRFSRYRIRFTRYYESTAYRRLQSELSNARRIHESQMPAMRTEGPLQLYYAYEPMRQIGGDLLFTHPPADEVAGKLSVVVFDVTGHGVTAGLFVNRIVGELERCFGENPDASPDDVLKALNSHVYYTLAKHSMYVTAVAIQIDSERNTLTYASGGHPDAFLVRPTLPVQRLTSTTFMLGVIEPARFSGEQTTLPFEKSAAVVAFTDGAIEARHDASGQALGTDGFEKQLETVRQSPPASWPESLLASVARHRQSPPEDDTLIVALFRT